MISWILMGLGVLSAITGIIGFISLFIILPIKERFEIVFDKEYDYIRARLDPAVRAHVLLEKEHLTRDFIIAVAVGVLLLFSGIYLGFAAEGEGFWLYQKWNPTTREEQVWDAINEDGQYISTEGISYTYYIILSGQDISFREERCSGLEELKEKLSGIRRENTVILIDSFAVSSIYHSVEDLLSKLGITYKKETR
ncbi:MAG: hypothetical protein IKV59_01405 [Lachnospiraceae bacterium]|nr:hypothetical protein [Lachnospiraceae bacterium]